MDNPALIFLFTANYRTWILSNFLSENRYSAVFLRMILSSKYLSFNFFLVVVSWWLFLFFFFPRNMAVFCFAVQVFSAKSTLQRNERAKRLLRTWNVSELLDRCCTDAAQGLPIPFFSTFSFNYHYCFVGELKSKIGGSGARMKKGREPCEKWTTKCKDAQTTNSSLIVCLHWYTVRLEREEEIGTCSSKRHILSAIFSAFESWSQRSLEKQARGKRRLIKGSLKR